MARTRRNGGVRSLPEKEVEVVSDHVTKLMTYCKPVMLYNILHTRLRDNPYFLPRRLSYKIQAKKLKDKTNSGGEITFNYMDPNNEKISAEVVNYFSCPFCSMKCGGHEGLKFHLTSSHDFFEYNFRLSGNDHPEIDVSLKPDALRSFGELSDGLEKHNKIPFTYLGLKSRKRLQSNVKRLNVHFLEMDLNDSPRDIENELSHANDDNVSSPARAHSPEKTGDILTITEPEIVRSSEQEIVESSEPKVPPASRRKMLYAERDKAKRIECLKERQFYHSKTYQPMSFEQVISDVDSETEVDHEFADIEERMRLVQLVNVSDEDKRFMWLWNTFMSKQRVIAYGHLPWACEEFTKLHVKELSQYFWQWKLFMIKLWNHGLISAKTMDICNTFLLNSQEAAAASTSQATTAIGNEQQQPAASSSTSQATTANGNEQQLMELDAERE